MSGLQFGLKSSLIFGLTAAVLTAIATAALASNFGTGTLPYLTTKQHAALRIALGIAVGSAATKALWVGLKGASIPFGIAGGAVAGLITLFLASTGGHLQLDEKWAFLRTNRRVIEVLNRIAIGGLTGAIAGIMAWAVVDEEYLAALAAGIPAGLATSVLIQKSSEASRFDFRRLSRAALAGTLATLLAALTLHVLDRPHLALSVGVMAGLAVAGTLVSARVGTKITTDWNRNIPEGALAAIVIAIVYLSAFLTAPVNVAATEALLLTTGGSAGLTVAILAGSNRAPSRGLRWNPRRGLLVGALAVGLIIVVPEGVGVVSEIPVVVALMIALGLERLPVTASLAMSPKTTLSRDRVTTWTLALAGGVLASVPTAIILRLYGVAWAVPAGLTIGLTVTVTTGLTVISFGTAWTGWQVARLSLAARHRLPPRIMAFLSDAHYRGILRQVGAFYQFRHINLQHQLAQDWHRRQTQGFGSIASTKMAISESGRSFVMRGREAVRLFRPQLLVSIFIVGALLAIAATAESYLDLRSEQHKAHELERAAVIAARFRARTERVSDLVVSRMFDGVRKGEWTQFDELGGGRVREASMVRKLSGGQFVSMDLTSTYYYRVAIFVVGVDHDLRPFVFHCIYIVDRGAVISGDVNLVAIGPRQSRSYRELAGKVVRP